MKLIVGLGNPDIKYNDTRHNVGFRVIDYISQNWVFNLQYAKRFNSLIGHSNFQGEQIVFAKPSTYMNLSGTAVALILNYYRIDISDMLIVYDDLSLDLGKIRFRSKGSSGGHNGIKSIISSLGNSLNFSRLKIGIGPQPENLPSEIFVLSKFSKEQLLILKEVLQLSQEAIEYYLLNTMEKSQNKYN